MFFSSTSFLFCKQTINTKRACEWHWHCKRNKFCFRSLCKVSENKIVASLLKKTSCLLFGSWMNLTSLINHLHVLCAEKLYEIRQKIMDFFLNPLVTQFSRNRLANSCAKLTLYFHQIYEFPASKSFQIQQIFNLFLCDKRSILQTFSF